jgi:hypothetical protein
MTQIWNLMLVGGITVMSVALLGLIAKVYWTLFMFGWGLL